MKIVLLVLGLITVSTPALTAPITFTGAELAALPGASFPTGGQTIDGDILEFNPTVHRAVLYRLDLSGFIVDPSQIGISVITQRLLSDSNSLDQDIRIGIFDGQNYISAFFGDIDQSSYVNGNQLIQLSPDETVLSALTNLGTLGPRIPVSIGDFIRLDATIRILQNGTEITSAVNQSLGETDLSPVQLNINGPLSLIIAGDNVNENNRITSLTFTSGVSLAAPPPPPPPPPPPATVVEPGALGGMMLGLTAIGFYRRRLRA